MDSEDVIIGYTALTCSATALLVIIFVLSFRLGIEQRKLKKVKLDKQLQLTKLEEDKQLQITKLEEDKLEKQLKITTLEEQLRASELKVIKRDTLLRRSLTLSSRRNYQASAV